jgi:hypothetical protein
MEDTTRYDGGRWTNSVLLSISQTLVDTGVVDTIEEENALVIPPFARRSLLPLVVGQVLTQQKDQDSDSVSR